MKNKKFESMVLDFVMAQMLHAHRLEEVSEIMGAQFGDCDLFDASRKTINLFLNMAAMTINPDASDNIKLDWIVETSPLGAGRHFVKVESPEEYFGKFEIDTVDDLMDVFKQFKGY